MRRLALEGRPGNARSEQMTRFCDKSLAPMETKET
jgi:hypothetical protein